MSITITINNNEAYVDEHQPELRTPLDIACQCCDYDPDSQPDPECHWCNGTGRDPIMPQYNYPFEMNVANANFSTIWNALGLEVDSCGELHPHAILKALDSVHPALMERADRSRCRQTAGGDEGAMWFEFGVDAERVSRYITKLREIALEAARREELIVWS